MAARAWRRTPSSRANRRPEGRQGLATRREGCFSWSGAWQNKQDEGASAPHTQLKQRRPSWWFAIYKRGCCGDPSSAGLGHSHKRQGAVNWLIVSSMVPVGGVQSCQARQCAGELPPRSSAKRGYLFLRGEDFQGERRTTPPPHEKKLLMIHLHTHAVLKKAAWTRSACCM